LVGAGGYRPDGECDAKQIVDNGRWSERIRRPVEADSTTISFQFLNFSINTSLFISLVLFTPRLLFTNHIL
jgi:hypothetical protein